VSDIDTVVVDGLKTLDPKRPIREGDIALSFKSTKPIKGLCQLRSRSRQWVGRIGTIIF
jgi:hypothetical protein